MIYNNDHTETVTLYDVDTANLTAKFIDKEFGECTLEFIDNNDCDGIGFIEPYIVITKEFSVELLETNIIPLNLYPVLQQMILAHKS